MFFFCFAKDLAKNTGSVPVLNQIQMNEKVIIENLLKSLYER